ncbi:hypothetical protein ABB07_01060 [Streptomyces incarnatus]|uniref:Htaa domain-containing protein n=2 Tax=Streptomyces incarnatus TaxID=665007 RepID=A0ABM5TCZ6_9ACTN|nr:hypothetical protein ABB07_01060 [Streptomyces incarnatus]
MSASPALSEAPLDRPPVRPASPSWVLRTDRLVLRGAAFEGVVTVRRAAGVVRMLKFTARSVDAVDLDVTAGRGRAAMRLRTGHRTTATLKRGGSRRVVTLYVRRLSGTVTGLGGAPLPADRTVTITPDAVPDWLSDPAVPARTFTFTDATVAQIAQFGGDLSVRGAVYRAAGG